MAYRHWIAALFALAVVLAVLFFVARPAGSKSSSYTNPVGPRPGLHHQGEAHPASNW